MHLCFNLGSELVIATILKFHMIGIIRMHCPITIARGVYSNPASPNKPWRFNNPYNIRPMTTVGIAIKVFKHVIKKFFPKKLFKATITPSGILMIDAITTAISETFNEVSTT